MGKSSAQTIGYHYRVAYHHGLSATPIDALLEIRCADKTAWSGSLAASGTININQPNLFGGEKDQGGIVGDVDVMFGEPTQTPNAYLGQAFGPQQPAWRGVTTLVFKGGRFGANNPYPQKPAYKVLVTKKGWDNDTCWYPTTCEVALQSSTVLPNDADGWQYQILPQQTNPGGANLTIPTSGWLAGGRAPFGNASGATIWPNSTILWAQRQVTVATAGAMLTAQAENGCVVFVDGAIVGICNPTNSDVGSGVPFQNVILVPISIGTHTITVKAYDEWNGSTTTWLTLHIDGQGLTAINPAHLLYDALTSQDRGSEPIASLNDANWRTGADWFFAQGIGVCTEFDPDSETVEQLTQRIEKVAACSVSRSPVDGEWYLDIANGVYTLASLPILTDDDILDFEEAATTLDDAINSVSVEYFDPQQKITVTTPPLQSLALINANGLHHDVRSYHELPTGDLANRTAQRDLQTAITPPRTFTLTTTRKPYAWRVNTYFRLQSPKRGIADIVCLLAEKSTGTLKSGAIKITASQDIYSMPTASFVTSEPGVDTRPPQIPGAILAQAVFEAPYTSVCATLNRADLAALPADIGYLMTVAQDPGQMRDYAITISVDGGTTYTDTGTDGPWCPTALIIEGDPLQDAAPATSFTLASPALLASVVVGQAALWQNLDGTFEICRVDAINPAATPPTLTLGRGCADTVPAAHAANARIWFFDGFAGTDTTEYTDGEAISVKLLTNSGTQQIDPVAVAPLTLTFDQRQTRPYPPATLQVNGAWYPSMITGALALAWVSRNRVTQADQLLDTTQAAVAGETGQTTTVRVYDDTNALLHTESGITAAGWTWPTADEGGTTSVPDPAWASVTSLLPLSAGLTDTKGPTWTQVGTNWSIASGAGPYGTAGYLTNASSMSADYIQTTDAACNLFSASKWTVDMRIRARAAASDGGIFMCGNTGSNSNRLMVQWGTSITVYTEGGSFATSGAVPMSLNVWHTLRVSWDGAKLYVFVDGALGITFVPPVMPTSGYAQFVVGSKRTGSNMSHSFPGDIADVRVTLGVCRSTNNYTVIWQPYGPTYDVIGSLHGLLRAEIESSRDGLASFQKHNITVRRPGYGFNYGMYYGGSS